MVIGCECAKTENGFIRTFIAIGLPDVIEESLGQVAKEIRALWPEGGGGIYV